MNYGLKPDEESALLTAAKPVGSYDWETALLVDFGRDASVEQIQNLRKVC